MNAPCLRRGTHILKLLASGDGTCFLTNLRMKKMEEKKEKQEREREREREKARKRERERERERMLGSGIGPCVRPVSDLFQTPAKGPSHIRKTPPRIRSTHASAPAKPHRSNLRRHVGATMLPLIADQRFRNFMLHKRLELRR